MGSKKIPREFREVFNHIKRRYPNALSECADAQSKLKFSNTLKHVVINAEEKCRESKNQTMCDRLVVFLTSKKTICFAAVELKGLERLERIKEQLQYCAVCLEQHFDSIANCLLRHGLHPKVVFIVVHKTRNASISALTDLKIEFRGRMFRVVPIKSGSSIYESESGFREWPRSTNTQYHFR